MNLEEKTPFVGRDWYPKFDDGIDIKRWFLLEGNRFAVTMSLLLTVFSTILFIGSVWTFEMRQLLTETSAVQSLLNTFLSGIILLVSIVVSISAIVLSYDIASLDDQEDRIEAVMEFQRDINQLSDWDQDPTNPKAFLELMTAVIEERANELAAVSQKSEGDLAEGIEEHTQGVMETVDSLGQSLEGANGSEFSALWRGLQVDYGDHFNRTERISLMHGGEFSDEGREKFDELVSAFQLFATGKEYFKTLYYTREISTLSRSLLSISLPTILFVATATLAIDAHLLPDFWMFGLPPLLTFVAFVFSVALSPYLLLTAYMVRVATVSKRTAAGGPFRFSN